MARWCGRTPSVACCVAATLHLRPNNVSILYEDDSTYILFNGSEVRYGDTYFIKKRNPTGVRSRHPEPDNCANKGALKRK